MDFKKDVSLLIIGYDPYIDVWNHYFELINIYWKDRPKTYLATNGLSPNYDGVTVIPTSNESEWSRKVQIAIEKIETKYVILLLEDFFTTKKVNNDYVIELVKLMEKYKIDYCKLLNQSKIKGDIFEGHKNLHVIGKEDPYGISLQPAIWNKNYLSRLLGDENYNAWIFEFNQVKNRIQNQEKINCIADDRNILQVTHAVVQSKYLRSAIRVFNRQGYKIDTSKREVFSIKENFKYRLKGVVSEYCPEQLREICKSIGRKMNVDFVSDRQLGGKEK